LAVLRRLLARNPVVALLGARQVGKTTLARQFAADLPQAEFFDLERAADLARLADPELALGTLTGVVVLDEIQRRPDLFPALRVLADRPRRRARYLVLGSAAPDLLRQGAESLAGRIAFHELPGLALDEVGATALDRLWLRGGFPRSFTARSNAESAAWRRTFVRTFLERDVPQLGIGIPASTLERFWAMLAHYHGQVWNGSEFGRSFALPRQGVEGSVVPALSGSRSGGVGLMPTLRRTSLRFTESTKRSSTSASCASRGARFHGGRWRWCSNGLSRTVMRSLRTGNCAAS
jgi:hypothetical protein